MQTRIHQSIIYNTQDMEMLIDGWMHKETVEYKYSAILFSHEKNEILLFATTKMDLRALC